MSYAAVQQLAPTLTTSQIDALTTGSDPVADHDAVQSLDDCANRGNENEQIGAFTEDQLGVMTTAQVRALTTVAGSEQLQALSNEQIAWLSTGAVQH